MAKKPLSEIKRMDIKKKLEKERQMIAQEQNKRGSYTKLVPFYEDIVVEMLSGATDDQLAVKYNCSSQALRQMRFNNVLFKEMYQRQKSYMIEIARDKLVQHTEKAVDELIKCMTDGTKTNVNLSAVKTLMDIVGITDNTKKIEIEQKSQNLNVNIDANNNPIVKESLKNLFEQYNINKDSFDGDLNE